MQHYVKKLYCLVMYVWCDHVATVDILLILA